MYRKKSIIILLFFCLNITMFYKLFDSQSGIPAYRELYAKIDEIKEKISQVDARNRQLSSEIRVLKKDHKYVERLIKRELYFVSDNELMYILK